MSQKSYAHYMRTTMWQRVYRRLEFVESDDIVAVCFEVSDIDDGLSGYPYTVIDIRDSSGGSMGYAI